MTEPRNDDRSQARREAATLLGVDIDRLSPADGLRVDMVSALRLVIDAEQASVLSGSSADLGKLNVAVQSLIALLPGRELPEPESRDDHEAAIAPLLKLYRYLHESVHTLTAENGQLRAALKAAAVPLPLDVPMTAEHVPINPPTSAIVPPGEIGTDCYTGVKPGPDDWRAQRSTTVIEGRAHPPAAKATHASPTSWDDTPNGRAWNEWRDAGGYGGSDRWANNNR
jgi:hypothetical protein